MSWAPLKKFIPKVASSALSTSAMVALALEDGTKYLLSVNPLLSTRVKLVSIRRGAVHAVVSSAPAAHELRVLREALFLAMHHHSPVELTDLHIEIRGSLDNNWGF